MFFFFYNSLEEVFQGEAGNCLIDQVILVLLFLRLLDINFNSFWMVMMLSIVCIVS